MTTTTANQRLTILQMLRERGSVTNVELNAICYRYGARLFELRQEGHLITTRAVHGKPRVFAYTYQGRGTDDDEPLPW